MSDSIRLRRSASVGLRFAANARRAAANAACNSAIATSSSPEYAGNDDDALFRIDTVASYAASSRATLPFEPETSAQSIDGKVG